MSSFPIEEGAASIEYCLKNMTVRLPYVEFDVTARTNVSGIKLRSAEIGLEYNVETFGSNLIANQNIEVAKEEIISDDVYQLNAIDETSQKVKVSISTNPNPNPNLNNLFSLSEFEQLLCHVKIKIENPSAIPDISFDSQIMQSSSHYLDPRTGELVEFEGVSLCKGFDTNLTGFTFEPTTIRAGVEDV